MSRDGESPERSALQEAASRKQGEPHILGVEGEAPAETTAPLQIDVDEFEEALRDPERQGFLREAHHAYAARLQAEQRTPNLRSRGPGDKST
ncbi:MAG: hypothetical protein H0V23_05165 [Nocardioidaceae bacterium]|nr:hypothetical protein [Nocardioidaceae bacterium]